MLRRAAGVPVRVEHFEGARVYREKANRADILFLDIDMPGMNGMELARLLEKEGKKPILIFLTALEEYVYEAFEVEAFGYLLKPVEEDKLTKVFRRAIKKATEAKREDYILVKSLGEVHRIAVSDILYVENQARKLIFHTKAGVYSCYAKMEDYVKQLPPYFFRCHRGYLISLGEVVSYDRNSVRLSNQECVLMARRKYEEFLQEMIEWME